MIEEKAFLWKQSTLIHIDPSSQLKGNAEKARALRTLARVAAGMKSERRDRLRERVVMTETYGSDVFG